MEIDNYFKIYKTIFKNFEQIIKSLFKKVANWAHHFFKTKSPSQNIIPIHRESIPSSTFNDLPLSPSFSPKDFTRISQGPLLEEEREEQDLVTEMTPLFPQTAFAENGGPIVTPLRTNLNKVDEEGMTPLTRAILANDFDSIKALISQGASVNDPFSENDPLYLATSRGHAEIVKILLANGANPRQVHAGVNVLHVATWKGYLDIVEDLLKDGRIDVNDQASDEGTALHYAAHNGHLEVVKVLLTNGADPRQMIHLMGNALHVATWKGHLDIVEYLLKDGRIDVNATKSPDDSAPLHLAALHGHQKVVELLLESGADSTLESKKTFATPLHLAAYNGSIEIAKLFPLDSANLHKREVGGRTPLHLAAQQGKKEMVQFLLDRGSNPNSLTNNGSTPAVEAHGGGYKELGEALHAKSGSFGQLWLASKMIAHEFGIGIKFSYTDRRIKLAGFNVMTTFSHLYESLKTFDLSTDAPKGWTETDSANIRQIVAQALSFIDQSQKSSEERVKEVLASRQKGEVIAIPTGWEGHANAIVLKNNLLIKCERSATHPGLSIYEMKDSAHLEECVTRLLNGRLDLTTQDFIENEIDQKLALNLIERIPLQYQRSKTCAWSSSAKPAYLAILYCYLLERRTPEMTQFYSQRMYKRWSQAERLRLMQTFLALPTNSREEETLKNHILACVWDSLRSKIDKNAYKAEIMQLISDQSPEAIRIARNYALSSASLPAESNFMGKKYHVSIPLIVSAI